MPSVSKKQHNLMAAVAKNPKFAKKTGIPQSVGKEFLDEDKGKTFRQGGISTSTRAKMNRSRTNHGMMQLPNVSLGRSVGKKAGGVLTNNEKEKDMKKMNPGMMAIMAKKKPMKMADGGMPMVMKDGKKIPAFAADGVGKMKKGGMACAPKKMMSGGMAMKTGGKAHSDMAKDKPMMKKVAKAEVKGHEKKMHAAKMAKGGGIEIKGKTKGAMVRMKKGGDC